MHMCVHVHPEVYEEAENGNLKEEIRRSERQVFSLCNKFSRSYNAV